MRERLKTGIDAWKFLVAHGGLEIDGRDSLLAEQLRTRLQPEASDIDTALNGVSIERFLNAFFELLRPFTSIMRDLLEYFERAIVKQGPDEWVLSLGEGKDKLQVNLDHFRQWLSIYSKQAAPHKVPVLDSQKVWKIQDAFRSLPGREELWNLDQLPFKLEEDVSKWLSGYERTSWLPLPGVVSRNAAQSGSVGEYAALVNEIASAVSSVVPNYYTMSRSLSALRNEVPRDIAADILVEHDRWVRNSVLNLVAFEHAGALKQRFVEQTLKDLMKDEPRRESRFHFQTKTLVEILSLPIWKKRYELYSAWIFTRFLIALKGHDIELHHENGRLRFAFHETLLATVRSVPQPLSVFSEKRVKAHGLHGHGRVSNIQPDYSVWSDASAECKLAIECKHYKKPSMKNFHDALYDYSTNLPNARVLLVNYGPITAELAAMTKASGEHGREFAWGNVNPEFPSELEAFEKTVRRIIGDPATRVANVTAGRLPVLIIDVSGSMKSLLGNIEVRKYILEIIQQQGPTQLAAVDDANRGMFGATAAGLEELVRSSPYCGTSLLGPAKTLAQNYSEVLILTDKDGLATLGDAVELLSDGPLRLARLLEKD